MDLFVTNTQLFTSQELIDGLEPCRLFVTIVMFLSAVLDLSSNFHFWLNLEHVSSMLGKQLKVNVRMFFLNVLFK